MATPRLLKPSRQRGGESPSAGFRETPRRSLYKAVSWRVLGSVDTIILATILTSGQFVVATKIGVAEIATKLILYFVHERVWSFALFGRESKISVRYRKQRPFGRKAAEKARRSAAKTVTWRVIASLDTMLLSWFFTGSLGIAAAIGTAEILTKTVLYYFHERVWARLRVGLERKKSGTRLPVAATPI